MNNNYRNNTVNPIPRSAFSPRNNVRPYNNAQMRQPWPRPVAWNGQQVYNRYPQGMMRPPYVRGNNINNLYPRPMVMPNNNINYPYPRPMVTPRIPVQPMPRVVVNNASAPVPPRRVIPVKPAVVQQPKPIEKIDEEIHNSEEVSSEEIYEDERLQELSNQEIDVAELDRKLRKRRTIRYALTGLGLGFSAISLGVTIGLPVGFLVPKSSEQNIIIPDQNQNPNKPNNPDQNKPDQGNPNPDQNKPDQGNPNPDENKPDQNKPDSGNPDQNKPTEPQKPELPQIMDRAPNDLFNETWARLNETTTLTELGKQSPAYNLKVKNYKQYINMFDVDPVNGVIVELRRFIYDPTKPTELRVDMVVRLYNYPYPWPGIPTLINKDWSAHWNHFIIRGFLAPQTNK